MQQRGSMFMNSQFFDAENNNAAPPNPQVVPVQSDFSTKEMRNTPGNTHECSPEIFNHTDGVSDVTDTYPHMEPDVESSSQQPGNSPTNPRSSKYNLRHIPKYNCKDDYRYLLVRLTNAHVDVLGNSRNALRGTYVAAEIIPIFLFWLFRGD